MLLLFFYYLCGEHFHPPLTYVDKDRICNLSRPISSSLPSFTILRLMNISWAKSRLRIPYAFTERTRARTSDTWSGWRLLIVTAGLTIRRVQSTYPTLKQFPCNPPNSASLVYSVRTRPIISCCVILDRRLFLCSRLLVPLPFAFLELVYLFPSLRICPCICHFWRRRIYVGQAVWTYFVRWSWDCQIGTIESSLFVSLRSNMSRSDNVSVVTVATDYRFKKNIIT